MRYKRSTNQVEKEWNGLEDTFDKRVRDSVQTHFKFGSDGLTIPENPDAYIGNALIGFMEDCGSVDAGIDSNPKWCRQ